MLFKGQTLNWHCHCLFVCLFVFCLFVCLKNLYTNSLDFTLCSSRRPFLPHGRSLEIPGGGGGVLKGQILEEMCEAKLEFPGG